MLNILISWGSPFRAIAVMIDSVAFTLIDQAYNVIVAFSSASLFKDETIQSVMNNTYIVIGIFALFRIAMLLVNAIINPDKLNEKGNGLGNVLANLIVMFVMLIMVPILFKEAYSLQETIVSGNYIQKIFLNSDSLDNINPGDTMRSIAIGSLITIDEEAQKQYKAGNCSKNCNKAIESYNDMAKKNNFKFTKLGKYIGVTIKDDDGNTVYVYNYMFVLTFLCGAAITYVLFSFGIDIAVRMVELAILQILAPMFIATYIDPKSAKTGPFHKWLTTVGKTYLSLFIKLAILSLMLLFISLLNGGLKQDIHGFNKLILLFAILIFAKKAPSWIGGMIGVDGEGSGLGGLGIGKKLKDGLSLLDNPVTRTAAGFAGAAIGNRLANRRRTKALKKEAGVDGRKNRIAKKQEIMRDGWPDKDGNKITGKGAYSAYLKDKGLNMGAKSMRNLMGMGNAMISGAKGGKDAGNFIGAIKGGVKASGEFSHSKGMNEKGIFSKAKDKVVGAGQKMNQIAYGSGVDIYDRNDKAEKLKKAENYLTKEAFDKMGKDPGNGILGMGDLTKLNVKPADMGEVYALAAAKANGYSCSRDEKGNLIIKDSQERIQSNDALMTQGRNMYTPEGAANLEKAYNTYQTQALTDGMANAQYMNQLAQSISAISDGLGKMMVPGGSTYELGDQFNNRKIEIGKESLNDLKDMHTDLNNKKEVATRTMVSSTDQETKQQCMQSIATIDSKIQAVDTRIAMKTQLEAASSELSNRQQQQEDYNRISKGITKEFKEENGAYVLDSEKTSKNAGKTDEEKKAMLASKAEKLQKIVDSFNPQKSNQ